MNEQDRVTFYLGMMDAGFEQGIRTATRNFEHLHKAADPKKLETGFQGVRSALEGLAGSYAIMQLVRGLKNVADAASEAETAQMRFSRALIANGIDANGANMLREYADQMKRFGFDDEDILSVQRIALNLGFGAEQAREFARVAIDLGGPLGNVTEAAQALANAHNGNARGLKQFGIYVDEVRLKSEGLNAVVAESDRLFRGQGMQMETAAERARLMATMWGDMKESLGDFVTTAVAYYAELFGAIDTYQNKQREMAGGNVLMQKAQELAEIEKQFAEQKKFYLFTTNGEERLLELGKRRRELIEDIGELQKKSVEERTPKSSVKLPVLEDPDAAKKAAEAVKAAHDAYWKAEDAAFNLRMQQMRDEVDAKGELIKTYDALAAAAGRVNFNAGMGTDAVGILGRPKITMDEGLQLGSFDALSDAVDMTALDLAEIGSTYRDHIHEQISLEEAIKRKEITGIEEIRARRKAAADDEIKSDMEAAQAAYQYAQVLIGTAQAIARGDAGGVFSGIGSGMMMAGGYAKNWQLFAAGAAVSTVGGLMGTGQSHSRGHIARDTIEDALGSLGLPKYGKMSPEAFGATGMGDTYQSWANIVGGGPAGASGARLLAEAMSKYNLTLGEQADIVGDLIARSQNLSAAEGDILAARAALYSADQMSLAQLDEMIDLYRKGTTWQQQYVDIQKQMDEDIKRAAGAEHGSSAEADALRALEEDRSVYIDLLRQDAEAKKAWEEKLRAEGMSAKDIALTKDGIDQSNSWLGSIFGELVKLNGGRIDNDPPPTNESYRVRSLNRGGDGGSAVSTFVVNLDGKEIARSTHRHIKRMVSFGEVSSS